MITTRFDELFAEHAERVAAGRHERDVEPADGGRWGPSVVLRLDPAAAEHLGALAAEIASLAGPDHFRTGHPDAVHVTVRALSAHRSAARPDEPLHRAGAEAMARTARTLPVPRFLCTGVTLTPLAVLAQLEPVDDTPWGFSGALGRALGPAGHFEARFHRDIFYSTLTHFTGPLDDGPGLVEWVRARRAIAPFAVSTPAAELVRADPVRRGGVHYMGLTTWARAPFAG